MTYSAPDGSRLIQDISTAGFYPQLVEDVVRDSLDGRQPVSHLVQLETHFNNTELHRHITVLVLAEDVLHITHVDDQQFDDTGRDVVARVSTETVGISQIRSVTLSYAYHQPQNYRPDTPIMELTLAVSWTGTQQLELYPAMCEDPECPTLTVRAPKASKKLFGHQGVPAVDTTGIEDLINRVALLKDQFPETASIDLNPVLLSGSVVTVLSAAVTLGDPGQRTDSARRAMRG